MGRTQTEGIRKSPREKLAPLASWRLERRVYGFRNGEIVCLGMEKGSSGVEPVTKPIRKHRKSTQKLKKTPSKEQKSKLEENSINLEIIEKHVRKVVVNSQGREHSVYLHRPYESLLWCNPRFGDKKDPPFRIAHCTSGNLITFGYIEIGVSKVKNEQFAVSENITYTLIKGNVKVTINGQESNLKEFDDIIVPAANVYSIHNTGKIPALLSFCCFKVPIFQYQYNSVVGMENLNL